MRGRERSPVIAGRKCSHPLSDHLSRRLSRPVGDVQPERYQSKFRQSQLVHDSAILLEDFLQQQSANVGHGN